MVEVLKLLFPPFDLTYKNRCFAVDAAAVLLNVQLQYQYGSLEETSSYFGALKF